MKNLRIVNVQVVSSTEIQVTFTENLTPNLVTANVAVLGNTPNVPNSEVLAISVNAATLTITCQPMVPFAAYFLQFVSTPQTPFISVNGDAAILQDGIANQYLITAPIDPDNPVKDYFVKFFTGNIYSTDVADSIVSTYIDSLATNLARCLYNIRQIKNENYLTFQTVDEQQFRGGGPYDRLYEEGAYEVMRVGLTPTNAIATMSITLADFPSFPITLQQQENTQTLTPSSTTQNGTFNINTLILEPQQLTSHPSDQCSFYSSLYLHLQHTEVGISAPKLLVRPELRFQLCLVSQQSSTAQHSNPQRPTL